VRKPGGWSVWLSRLKAEQVEEFYRMNMPFELGIEYGSRHFGSGMLGGKKCLILEKERYDFMRALSDLSGVDIKSHSNEPDEIVRAVRDWFVDTVGLQHVERPGAIWFGFNEFSADFYKERKDFRFFSRKEVDRMPVSEYIDFIKGWVTENEE